MRGFFIMILFFIYTASCSELYNDYEIDTYEDFLVVDGMISDNPGPYFVTLYRAMPFSSNYDLTINRQKPETNATVIIKSDKNEEIMLHELDSIPGYYATYESEITGEQGHNYWLYVRTINGEEYESYPSKITDKPYISSIDMKIETREEINYNVYGKQELVLKKGMNISADILFTENSGYYKIDAETIVEMIFISEGGNVRYCWNIQKEELPNIIAIGNNTFTDNIKNIHAVFIYPYNIPERLLYSDYELLGYLVNIKAYSIDQYVYEYYRNVKNQYQAFNKLFDPIPLELKGNINCVSEPGRNTYGIFIASSVEHKQYFILGDGTREETTIKAINDFDRQISNYILTSMNRTYCDVETRPFFWQDQYEDDFYTY